MDKPKKISVEKAAEIMGTNPRFIRYGLQQGKLPFGFAVKMTRWAYIIYEDKFLQWLNGIESNSDKYKNSNACTTIDKNYNMYEVEIIPTEVVAKLLHTTPARITAMVINGTLPIGAAVKADKENKENNRAIIIKKRLEAWLNAEDLKTNYIHESK